MVRVLGPRLRAGVLEVGGGGINRNGELDGPAELPGEGMRDQWAQPGLKLLLHKGVRGGDQGSVFHQAERPGQLEPGELAGLDMQPSEAVQGPGPNFSEVYISHGCDPLPSRSCRACLWSGPAVHRSIHMLCTCLPTPRSHR